jgi:peptidoglycan/xylan/chitin deacetylase (PgdA/CDA1 family)
MLRILGWRPLTPGQLRRFHSEPDAVLPRRRFVLTADDGFADAVHELAGHGNAAPQLFAVTKAVGRSADWFGGTRLATWAELRTLQKAGGSIGSHARQHVPLTELDDRRLRDELTGSLGDLLAETSVPVPMLAYPHGRHDARVRLAAIDAGYALAYTTAQGRNGAGTDPWCLRRVEPKIWDTGASFLWKVVTGYSPPGRWERILKRRWDARQGHLAGSRV